MLLCERFPALSPFSVDRERFRDVVAMFVDLKHNAEKRGAADPERPPEGSFTMGGTLYVPAKDDDWY